MGHRSVVRIDRVDDPRLDVFRDLTSPRDPRFASQFVVEGMFVTERLLASPLETVAIASEERFVERLLAQTSGTTPLYVIPRTMVRELTGFDFHRGVLGCGRRPVSPRLSDLLPPPPAAVTLAVCVGIQAPENLGGIIRSSAALGAHAAVCGPGCADPFSRRVARTSMGANLKLPIVQADQLECELHALREHHGVRLVATVLDPAAKSLGGAPKPRRVALLFGSESGGLDRRWVELCDDRVTIPMAPGVDSLNASVAAGIFLYFYTV
jgi:tRNA G18 (ribose-2'-O)-methylase SpoU